MPISFDSLPKNSLIQGCSNALDLIVRFDDLGELCQHLNTAYRRGEPLVSDTLYDQVFLAGLRKQQPDHPFLHNVEPEPVNPSLRRVQHASPLLSTSKAYSVEEVARYVRSVERAATDLGTTPQFSLTAKLDGVAANDDGKVIATRGDGLQGEDVTHIVERGVVMHGGRGRGRGEVVVEKAIFEAKLGRDSEHGLDHVRNFVAGFLGSDTIKDHHRLALDAGALHFMPFDSLPTTVVDGETLIAEWDSLYDAVVADTPYLTDGVVVSVTDPALREAMGATNHHERAVLAIKKQGDTVTTRVQGVRLSVGRTGRIIPTLLLDPVYLSGANVGKASAHTATNIAKLGLGEGAEVEITRSGEVIPKLLQVVTASPEPVVVTRCPVCDTPAEVEGEHMVCPNSITCSAQAEARLRHWFHTLGNVDGFGPETIRKMVAADIVELRTIYALTEDNFLNLGFGPGQSRNLEAELVRSREEPVRDWRWLAALGIRHLGKGDARRLLAHIPLRQLGDVTTEEIAAIEGFGPKTSSSIAETLVSSWPWIEELLALEFNLQSDTDAPGGMATSPLAGKRIVFTGTMESAKRKDLEEAAAEQGAQVQSDISATTEWLVAGAKAGSKLEKARKLIAGGKANIEILSEDDYLARVG